MRRAKSLDKDIERNLELAERKEILSPRAIRRSAPRRFVKVRTKQLPGEAIFDATFEAFREIGERTQLALDDGTSEERRVSTRLPITSRHLTARRLYPFNELDYSLIPSEGIANMSSPNTAFEGGDVEPSLADRLANVERLLTGMTTTLAQVTDGMLGINDRLGALEAREGPLQDSIDREISRLRETMNTTHATPGPSGRTTVHFDGSRNQEEEPRRSSRFVPTNLEVNDLSYAPNVTGTREIFHTIKTLPLFNGKDPKELPGFLTACKYVYHTYQTAEEKAQILRGIIALRVGGDALDEVQTRRILSMQDLEDVLTSVYKPPRTASTVQRELLYSRQGPNESAHQYGNRVSKLLRELIATGIDDKDSLIEKNATVKVYKKQTLTIFEDGLRDDLKVLVKSQRPADLQEAITIAIDEERSITKRPATRGTNPSTQNKNKTASRYCDNCKRSGHDTKECWKNKDKDKQNGKKFYPENNRRVQAVTAREKNEKPTGRKPESQRPTSEEKHQPRHRSADSTHSTQSSRDSSESPDRDSPTRKTAQTYRMVKIGSLSKDGHTSDRIEVEIKNSKNKQTVMLIDSGAEVSLIARRALTDNITIRKSDVTLVSFSGEKTGTLGKIEATFKINGKRVIHPLYVVEGNTLTNADGILGIDFLKDNGVTISYPEQSLLVNGKPWKTLNRSMEITIPARAQQLIMVPTDSIRDGIIEKQQLAEGIYLGEGLTRPKDGKCVACIINTTTKEKTVIVPRIQLNEIPINEVTRYNDSAAAVRALTAKETLTTRIARVFEQVDRKHMNKEEKAAMEEICRQYHDTFHLPGDKLSMATVTGHRVSVKSDTTPCNIKPYRLPEIHKQEVRKQVEKMLEEGIIRHSASPWNAPLLVVPKKTDNEGNKKYRVVVDYRKLNEVTIGDSFPLPNITDILDQLGKAQYFTTLDLASGYHQIPMDERDKCKTAFSTPQGHFEFNRMPFGLKNAPATFQGAMNAALIGLQGIDCFVYLDDLVIYGANLMEHDTRLRKILDTLRKYNLKLQPEKCAFLRNEVGFLGHVITPEGIKPDPEKTKAVKEFPTPTKLKELQAFLGLAGYYRRFIPGYSKIAKPLSSITSSKVEFIWTAEQQNAFDTLKEALTTAPLLIYPDFRKEFIITTDASGVAIGAILSQGKIGEDKPIAYASRVLNKAERNYSTTEKELLAIVWAVKHFRPYVYGTPFKVVTDHKALIWLFRVQDPGSRLIRWRILLAEYDYEIIHKSGKNNTNADALSRNVHAVQNEEEETRTTNVHDEETKQQILYEYHRTPIGGHQGIKRTTNRIKQKYSWEGMNKDIEEYIQKCSTCQKNKLGKKTRAPMEITDTPRDPFEKVALDIVGPLPESNQGNIYILTFQDLLTKFSKAIPLPNQEAATVAEAVVERIICEYGIPGKILTDQGRNFISEMFKNICKLFQITKIQTTAYHPESNGALERSHRTLVEYLRHYIDNDQSDWDKWLPYAMFTYNTTPHTATGFTPYELVYGKTASLPTALKNPPKQTYNYEDYAQQTRERIRTTNEAAREQLRGAKEKAKKGYDKKTREIEFKVGDKVWLFDESVRRGRSKKLDNKWVGPYIIIGKNSKVNVTLKKGQKTLHTHANRLKHFIE